MVRREPLLTLRLRKQSSQKHLRAGGQSQIYLARYAEISFCATVSRRRMKLVWLQGRQLRKAMPQKYDLFSSFFHATDPCILAKRSSLRFLLMVRHSEQGRLRPQMLKKYVWRLIKYLRSANKIKCLTLTVPQSY